MIYGGQHILMFNVNEVYKKLNDIYELNGLYRKYNRKSRKVGTFKNLWFVNYL